MLRLSAYDFTCRAHLLLAADGTVYFILALVDLLPHVIPAARNSVTTTRVAQLFLGMWSCTSESLNTETYPCCRICFFYSYAVIHFISSLAESQGIHPLSPSPSSTCSQISIDWSYSCGHNNKFCSIARIYYP